ncbi:membrane protein insertase YidC, partial [Rickettsiales bacterium]|nr:membrane protein insertase YidC [Rickettsiales bacterium]
MNNNNENNSNILWATILSIVVLVAWTFIYEAPRVKKAEELRKVQQDLKSKNIESSSINNNQNFQQEELNIKKKPQKIAPHDNKILVDEELAVKNSFKNRVIIKSDKLSGSINLQGAKFDNLYLNQYRDNIDEDSANVVLFAPANSKERYFSDFGWVSSESNVELPNSNTVWRSDSKEISPNSPVTLSWENGQNIKFSIKIYMDQDYMFNIEKSIENLSGKSIKLASYGRVSRLLPEAPVSNYILHEGPIGVFDEVLFEAQYKDLAEENNQRFESDNSWIGLTDKYWLTAIIPDKQNINAVFNYSNNKNGSNYNAEFITDEFLIDDGGYLSINHNLFAGAKEVVLLDKYAKKYDIDLFDRAVDFGWYYFLTKPFFFILKFFNSIFGNYGLAILAITVLIKLAMFPLAAKSYSSMAKIRKLQPKIEAIRKNNKDNKMQVNKDMMELYKTEKVNPAAGCLPMLVQIPVFFSLYKVLFITIDMRHQPFFGWIKDLSAPDPTSIFNLFGLLPFEVGVGFFMIGIWPILMGLTMVLQQKLGPKMTDPIQAKVMKILPFI